MVITKTPFRMSFFGGGTDIESFFKEYGGAVISTTFDKYCYVNVRHLPPFFDYSTELSYSLIERVSNINDIQHPVVRNAMKMLNMDNIRLTYEADLPAKSGLGTSSSFAVGTLHAFHALKGQYVSKNQLADEGIHLERNLCDEKGGWQDQIATSFGGFNRIDFHTNGTYVVKPLLISSERRKQLNDNLMLFFTGFTRFSFDIQKTNLVGYYNKHEYLKQMCTLVDSAETILENRNCDLNEFGQLLDETWKLKRLIGNGITTSYIDELYNRGIEAGAIGGKLLGAGGGGFFLFYVSPEKQKRVREVMKDLLYVPFNFEEAGTQVLYYSPEVAEMKDMDR